MKTVFKMMGKILLALLIMLLLLAAAVFVQWRYRSAPSAVISYETQNPFITGRTQISAHRSGAGIYPEESMMALRACVENPNFEVDTFEFDLHITRDDVLVLLHDHEMDRTTDSEAVFGRGGVQAEEMTYEELRQLNIGAKFTADDGSMPYVGPTGEALPDELRIVALEDALDYLESVGQYNYIIEVKDGGEVGCHAADLLIEALKKRGMLDRVAFGSFHGEVSDHVTQVCPELVRGASPAEVIEFILAALTNKKDYAPDFRVLQLPFNILKESYGINLGLARFINYAHAHDLAVQYWTVNREEDMDYLLSVGADCIMSDYPDRLYSRREAQKK